MLIGLPGDYVELNKEAQRKARIHACSAWVKIPRSDPRRVKAFLQALDFFDSYYLWNDDGSRWGSAHTPGFYSLPLTSPACHRTIAASFATYRYTVAVAPRGAAKSMLLAKIMTLYGLVEPRYNGILYLTASDELASRMGDRIRDQLYHVNDRIREDWSKEMGGKIQPKRNELQQGVSAFKLNNRTGFIFKSINSLARGLRPDLAAIDDVEYDPSASTSMQRVRDDLETSIRRVVLPMIQEPHSSALMVGTFISKRHMLWKMMATEEIETPDGPIEVPAEPAFGAWSRLIIPAAYEGEDGNLRSFWPHKWPANEMERTAYGVDPEYQTLEQIKATIGPGAFSAEYMCQPGDDGTAWFGHQTKELDGWWLEGVDDAWVGGDILSSNTLICWNTCEPHTEPVKRKMRVAELPARIAFCDYAPTAKPTSDAKTCGIFCITSDGEILCLDGWLGRTEIGTQITEIMRLNKMWATHSTHVDSVKDGQVLFQELQRVVWRQQVRDGWSGPVVEFRARAEKTGAIAALQPLFAAHRIKFPYPAPPTAYWREMAEQIAGFTPHMENGGLEHDDAIDGLASAHRIFAGKPLPPAAAPSPATLKERMMRIEQEDEHVRPHLITRALYEMPLKDIIRLVEEREAANQPDDEENYAI